MMVSPQMRDVLIEHLDGKKVRIRAAKSLTNLEKSQAISRRTTVECLLRRGWLHMVKSTHTQITVEGRERLAELLGEYADAISSVPHEPHNPFAGMQIGATLASMLERK